ncbi:MAG: PEP-utilizing enzyme [Candidatus Woesearchaeota archaeon]
MTYNNPNKKFRKMFSITMGLCRGDIYMPTHAFNIIDIIGRGHDDIIFKIENGKNTGYFSEEVIEYMGKHGLERLYSKEFVENNKKKVDKIGKELWSYSEYITSLPIKHIETEILLKHYNELFKYIQKMFGYFNVSQPCISFALEEEIAKKMKEHGLDADTQYKILNIMLKPDKTTLIEEEEKDLIKIALKIKADKRLFELFQQPLNKIIDELHHLNNNNNNNNLINNNHDSNSYIYHNLFNELIIHENKYMFLASSENFDEFAREYFIDRIKDMIIKKKDELEHEIISKTPDVIALSIERKKIMMKHALSSEVIHLIDVAREYSYQRMLIRIFLTKAINVWGKLLREFARKMNISEVDVQYLLKDEINAFFENKYVIEHNKLKKRKQLSIFAIFDRNKPILLTGEEAREFKEQYLKEDLEELSKKRFLKGTIVSKGFAKGKVKILAYGKNMVKQINEMEHGDVLVTGNTRPDMIIAMKKASAIVTNEGGIMSHAALISRELGIPCIVGTKDATEMFKDGDIVEVDADNGIVRKIKNLENTYRNKDE